MDLHRGPLARISLFILAVLLAKPLSPAFSSTGDCLFSCYTQGQCNVTGPNAAPAARTRYKTGLLVELRDGRQVLVTNEYLGGGHRAMANWITDHYGPIRKFLWGGEIEYTRVLRKGAKWVITRANETSGMLFKAENTGDAIVENKVENLQAYLEATHPEILGNPKYEKFNPEAKHLFDVINQNFKTGNIRHDLRDAFNPTVTLIDMIRMFGGRLSQRSRPVAERQYALLKAVMTQMDPKAFEAIDVQWLYKAYERAAAGEAFTPKQISDFDRIYRQVVNQMVSLMDPWRIKNVREIKPPRLRAR